MWSVGVNGVDDVRRKVLVEVDVLRTLFSRHY